MNRHLTENEITECLIGAAGAEISAHLHACPACSDATARFHETLARYRENLNAAADRDPAFWTRQRATIAERLRSRRVFPLLRWAVNAVAVLVLLAAFLLVRAPQPSQRVSSNLSDDALLDQVATDVDRDYPAALAPAALIEEARNVALANLASSPVLNDKEQHR